MSEAKESQEPTMEEILASIRRIISEDGEPEGEGESEEAASEAAEPEPEEPSAGDNVLELTEVVEEEEPAEPEPEPEPAAEEEEITLDDGGDTGGDVAPEPEPLPDPEPEPALEIEDFNDEGLVSPATAQSTATAFTDMTSAVNATRGMGLGQNQTLEAIVKELLRPMLKDWLDENLTALVQRIVEREVVKLAGRAEDDELHS